MADNLDRILRLMDKKFDTKMSVLDARKMWVDATEYPDNLIQVPDVGDLLAVFVVGELMDVVDNKISYEDAVLRARGSLEMAINDLQNCIDALSEEYQKKDKDKEEE